VLAATMKLDSYETWTERVPLTRPYTIAYERKV